MTLKPRGCAAPTASRTSRALLLAIRASWSIAGGPERSWYEPVMEDTMRLTAAFISPVSSELDQNRAVPLGTAEVECLAAEIAELSAHLDAATHRLLTLIRRFDEGSGWYAHGALSCAHWLSWRIGLDLCAAREKVRVARAIGSLPCIDDALRQAQVSYSKVRALTRVATPENEAALLEMARSATASQLERICRAYRRAQGGLLGELPGDEGHRRWVRESSTDSGMVRIEAQLTPEEAAVVWKALEAAHQRAMAREWQVASTSAESSPRAADPLVPTESRPMLSSLQRADALVAVAETYLAVRSEAGGPAIEVVLHVAADSLADVASREGGTLDDGTYLPRATTERLACDAAIVAVVEDKSGTPLDVGRRRRTIPTALRRALHLRDRGRAFKDTRMESLQTFAGAACYYAASASGHGGVAPECHVDTAFF
jgi:hypothetical protein